MSQQNPQNEQGQQQQQQQAPQQQQAAQQQGYPNQQAYQQQQYAPSAYSAPQPGYGYPQAQGPKNPSPFAALFSPDVSKKAGKPLANLVMLFAIVAFGIFAIYQLFDMIDIMTRDYTEGMQIVTALFAFVFALAKGLVVLGGIRLALECVPSEDSSQN